MQISGWKKKLIENRTDMFAKKGDKSGQEDEEEKSNCIGKSGN